MSDTSSAQQSDIQDFFVVAYEAGAEHPALPTWASKVEDPVRLSNREATSVSRRDIAEVPAAFQLLNLLSPEECQAFIDLSEALGYLPDAAVSLPREIRHNDNLVWVVDDSTHDLLWQRTAKLCQDQQGFFHFQQALGLNARFRFYRYGPGDYFKPHTDGAWPGSRVIQRELLTNAYPDRYSQMTFLILLNENFEGGATRFLLDAQVPGPARQGSPIREVDVRTPAGAALCFPHGLHPLHCVHSSEPIVTGTKYIIRTDLLFAI